MLGGAAVLWLIATAIYCARDANPLCGLLVALTVRAITPLWLAVPAWALVAAVRRAQARAYAAAALAALIPAIAVAVPGYGPFLGVYLRFQTERPGYAARIDAAWAGRADPDIAARPSVIAFFPWRTSAAGSFGVVYDESDAIAEPLERRQALWRQRAVPPTLLCEGRVRPLGGHFYSAGFNCP